ncbi:hypothetical protein CPLU01_10938 [Colletotrichum plurivorum]|uniref:Heterokaryon incompatibility domain-containing protein n=1 Tax=Colletotrichum plurivorum TaxID=2175906 RepID=A0A8H6N944_9PEZI|nr:hypothetical protein CPLU01_10938 [Colletotrichum plurivorum]
MEDSPQTPAESTPAEDPRPKLPWDWEVDPEDVQDDEPPTWLPDIQSILSGIRSSVIIFVIDQGLPAEHRWIYSTLFLYHQFSKDVIDFSWVRILLLWWFPKVGVGLHWALHSLDSSADNLRSGDLPSTKRAESESVKTAVQVAVANLILAPYCDLEGFTPALEALLGPSTSWPWVILPIFPGLVWKGPRKTGGALVPEGYRGIPAAILAWAGAQLLPPGCDVVVYVWATAPFTYILDHRDPLCCEWLFYSAVWCCYGVPAQLAYILHTFAQKFLHQELWLRQNDEKPTVILRRERVGWAWFVITTFHLRALEVNRQHLVDLYRRYAIPTSTLRILCGLAIAASLCVVVYRYFRIVPAFRYQPLKKGHTSIRVLRLRAQPPDAGYLIQCDLIHVSLDSPPRYRTVSHRWGWPGEEPRTIMVNGAQFPVSQSIYDLLENLRSSRRSYLLWIDSVCIDQSNAREKSRQVGMMRRIYEEAESTIAWLGNAPGAAKAMTLVKKLVLDESMNAEGFAQLTRDPNSGWMELRTLLSNDWFNRIWIIQEIAVSRETDVLYGGSSLQWQALAMALARLHSFALASSDELAGVMDSQQLMNALVMENVRLQVDDVDRLALKDVLKLGSRFRATLPVDKVFGLLGVAKERHAPLFHPNYELDDKYTERTFAGGAHWRDMMVMVDSLRGLLLPKGGRRGKAIGPKGSRNRRRHEKEIFDGIRHISSCIDNMKAASEGNGSAATAAAFKIHPGYTGKTTPEVVYATVARDLVGKRDAVAFLRHAGVGFARNPALGNLPSWAPDWSSERGVYVLPHYSYHGLVSVVTALSNLEQVSSGKSYEERKPEDEEPSVRDGGLSLLHVKGAVVGEIVDTTMMWEGLAEGTGDPVEDAKRDLRISGKIWTKAYAVAKDRVRGSYASDEDFSDAFLRVLVADRDSNGISPAPKAFMRVRKTGFEAKVKFWAILERHSRKSSEDDPYPPATPTPPTPPPEPTTTAASNEIAQKIEHACRKFLRARRIQSSPNSRFAHLVRADVLPSFNRYRWQDVEGVTASFRKEHAQLSRTRMLHMHRNAFLNSYQAHVDYALGRRLAVTGSGFMGLVPPGSQAGDVVVWVERERLCLVLRPCLVSEDLRRELERERRRGKGTSDEEPGEGCHFAGGEAFRLVGDAYFHRVGNKPGASQGEREEEAAGEKLVERWFDVW